MKKIEVEWLDSEILSSWQSYDAADNFSKADIVVCRSTGYLFLEDERVVVLVQSYNSDNVSEMIKIPKFSIRKRKFT